MEEGTLRLLLGEEEEKEVAEEEEVEKKLQQVMAGMVEEGREEGRLVRGERLEEMEEEVEVKGSLEVNITEPD